jgi:hypothetical protein
VAFLAATVCSIQVDAEPRDHVVLIQSVIDELRGRLSMPVTVTASMVPSNPLLVSVEPAPGREAAFQLTFEDRFLETLDDEELRAVVAHELGHVWIFTHHPYLQTEQLANEIALRLVSRESLQRVYAKVWARNGQKGDIARFLGQ